MDKKVKEEVAALRRMRQYDAQLEANVKTDTNDWRCYTVYLRYPPEELHADYKTIVNSYKLTGWHLFEMTFKGAPGALETRLFHDVVHWRFVDTTTLRITKID